jgi:hypothetical protein
MATQCHDCRTVQEAGWGAYSNDKLLQLAEPEFDLFVTPAQNIRYQQNLTGRKIAILVLSTNNLAVIQANAVRIVTAVQTIQVGAYVELLMP